MGQSTQQRIGTRDARLAAAMVEAKAAAAAGEQYGVECRSTAQHRVSSTLQACLE